MTCLTLLLFMALSGVVVSAEQTDVPLPPDLAERLESERRKADGVLAMLRNVRAFLSEKSRTAGGDDLNAVAVVVHADFQLCITEGDQHRAVAKLYAGAAGEAAQVAARWEHKATSPEGSSAAAQQRFELQTKALGDRAVALRSGPLGEAETLELQSLEKRLAKLREMVASLAAVDRADNAGAEYAHAASQMRQQELYFRLMEQEGTFGALFQDVTCVSKVHALRLLQKQDERRREFSRHGVTLSGVRASPATLPAKPVAAASESPSLAATVAGAAVGQVDRYLTKILDGLAVVDGVLSDPEHLRKLADKKEKQLDTQ